MVHNILFKFALDAFGLFGGSDLSAAKGYFSIYFCFFFFSFFLNCLKILLFFFFFFSVRA